MKAEAGHTKPPAVWRSPFARRFGRMSIRNILVVTIICALAPLAMLAAWEGARRVAVEQATVRKVVMLTTIRAGGIEATQLDRMQAIVELVASAPPSVHCGALLETAKDLLKDTDGVASFDASGRQLCASKGATVKNPTQPGAGLWHVSSQPNARIVIARQWAIGDGRIITSIDVDRLTRELQRRHGSREQIIAISDAAGGIVAASRPMPWAMVLPASTATTPTLRGDRLNNRWLYASVPIARDNAGNVTLRLIALQKQPGLLGRDSWFIVTYIGFPLLAIMVASLVLWFALDRFLNVWTAVLRRDAILIGTGHYQRDFGQYANAPSEIRSLAASLRQMMRRVAQRDSSLSTALARQADLVMELHHRVRNNLQVIASFLALQEADVTAARRISEARLRVAGLAMVHRLMFDSGEMTNVAANVLFPEIAALFERQEGLLHLTLARNVPDPPVDIDAAVTLTLWVIQVASTIGSSNQPIHCHMSLAVDEHQFSCTISWVPPPRSDVVADDRSLKAFARQINGYVVGSSGNGAGDLAGGFDSFLTLECPLSSLNRRFVASPGNNPGL